MPETRVPAGDDSVVTPIRPGTPIRPDPDAAPPVVPDAFGSDLQDLARSTAQEAEEFLTTVTEVAAGSNPEAAVRLLLLAVSDIIAAGARLGAIVDVVPEERFEPDDGPDPDVDPLRLALANLFADIDEYVAVTDPLQSSSVSGGTLSGDIAAVAQALSHGLVHSRAGHLAEALWWWQFSYVASWGDAAANALRVLLSVLAHLRLDVDEEVAAEAEFDALHR